MLKSAKYLIVDIHEALIPLEKLADDPELPTLDLEAILSGMIQVMEKPNLTGKCLDDAVKWLLQTHGLTSAQLDDSIAEHVRAIMYFCLLVIRRQFLLLNPYLNGHLPYHHKRRHGQRNVLLEYNSPIASHCHH